jgi:fluoride exporter
LLVTGLLGGLTTFSTFSAEIVYMLQHGRYGWAVMTASAHLFGSLLLTLLGFATYTWLKAP